MKKKNLIILSICVIILLIGVVIVFLNKPAFDNTLIALGLKKAEPVLANADPYMQKLLRNIPVLQVMPKKKKDVREIWKVGRGISYPNYLLRAQKHLNKFGGKVLSMEELENKNGKSVADLNFVVPFGDTFHVELQVADSFYNKTSQLAVAFYANKQLPQFVSKLNSLNYPYSLLITPSEKTVLNPSLNSLKEYSPVIWQPMESKKFQSKDLAKSTIYIHQSEAEIQSLIQAALDSVPGAQGVATRNGDRAVEQQVLLKATFAPLKEKQLWFMDLSNNRYSRVSEVCEEIDLMCRTVSAFDPSRMTHAIYANSILKLARKSGKAVLILPLSDATFNALDSLEVTTQNQGTEIVHLSNIFQNE